MADDHRHDDPVDVAVVADKRDTLGKRLGAAAIAMLLFLFIILALIQSAKNGKKLDEKHPVVVPTPNVSVTVVPMPTLVPVLTTVPSPVIISNPGTNGRDGRDGRNGSPGTAPRSSPSPKPSPTKSPVVPVGQTICDLTGIGCPPEKELICCRPLFRSSTPASTMRSSGWLLLLFRLSERHISV